MKRKYSITSLLCRCFPARTDSRVAEQCIKKGTGATGTFFLFYTDKNNCLLEPASIDLHTFSFSTHVLAFEQLGVHLAETIIERQLEDA